MPKISFSPNIRSHVEIESTEVSGSNLREALESVFATHPRLRGYLLDDLGNPRKHIALIINGEPIRNRSDLSDSLEPGDDIFVMQALSGG